MDTVPADWLDVPVSVEEAEAAYGKPASGVRAAWERLKGEMQPGDTLMRFVSSAESWRHLAGRAGIALLRDGEVIDSFVILMN